MTIVFADNEHEVGNKECPVCYGSPTPCACGGLIHHEFYEENWDSVILSHKCDKCGKDEE